MQLGTVAIGSAEMPPATCFSPTATFFDLALRKESMALHYRTEM